MLLCCYNEMAWIWTQDKNWCITVWALMDYFFYIYFSPPTILPYLIMAWIGIGKKKRIVSSLQVHIPWIYKAAYLLQRFCVPFSARKWNIHWFFFLNSPTKVSAAGPLKKTRASASTSFGKVPIIFCPKSFAYFSRIILNWWKICANQL